MWDVTIPDFGRNWVFIYLSTTHLFGITISSLSVVIFKMEKYGKRGGESNLKG